MFKILAVLACCSRAMSFIFPSSCVWVVDVKDRACHFVIPPLSWSLDYTNSTWHHGLSSIVTMSWLKATRCVVLSMCTHTLTLETLSWTAGEFTVNSHQSAQSASPSRKHRMSFGGDCEWWVVSLMIASPWLRLRFVCCLDCARLVKSSLG